MPPFVRPLFTIFLGLPGILMWLGGFGAWMYGSLDLVLKHQLASTDRLGGAAGVLGVCLIGFMMTTAVGVATGAPRYRIPAKQLPACIGFDFLVLTLWMLVMGGLVSTLLALGMGRNAWTWIGYDLAVLSGLLAAVRFQRSYGRKRTAEAMKEARDRLEGIPG